jgi:hypothetical protein
MTTLVGRKAMFNPILNGGVYYGNGIEIIPKKNAQVRDGTILGIITEERQSEVFIAGAADENGWFPLYLMSKQFINLLETDLQYLSDNQISN